MEAILIRFRHPFSLFATGDKGRDSSVNFGRGNCLIQANLVLNIFFKRRSSNICRAENQMHQSYHRDSSSPFCAGHHVIGGVILGLMVSLGLRGQWWRGDLHQGRQPSSNLSILLIPLHHLPKSKRHPSSHSRLLRVLVFHGPHSYWLKSL